MITAVVLTWVVLALGAALLIGRCIRLADLLDPFPARLPDLPAELPVDEVPPLRTPLPSR